MSATNAAAYSYLANSSLVGQILFASNTFTSMTTAKQYDFLNRLSSISSSPSNAFNYEYNAANQRTMDRLSDGSYWSYGYDALGQVISGSKYWADETPVAGQQFDYAFDTIGNRTQTEAGGDQNGANLRVAYYTNNNLNQITSRPVPGYVDIMGDGIATNAVGVNGLTAYRKNEFFRQQVAVNNSSAAVWTSITVTNNGSSVSGHAFVAQTPETFSYDVDGNLSSDGRWNYSWDAENRLTNMTSLSSAPGGSQLQLAFTYDYMGRRIQKLVSTNNGSAYVGEYTNTFAYDGWNCIAVLNSSLSLLNSFLWGSDLSGSLQGAGGVGGLLKVTYYGTTTTNCFVAFDGNGNVSALVNAANGTTVANYECGPFGEVIRATGPMAKLNPFRFSTKYEDDESDFLYYGYRYYNPSTGRWINRDPLFADVAFLRHLSNARIRYHVLFEKAADEETKNLYAFLQNEPLSRVDLIGLDQITGGGEPVLGNRHQNQVFFNATCPPGMQFVFDGVDYSRVYQALLLGGFSSEFLNSIPPGNPPSNLGGVPGPPSGVNCDGKQVSIWIFMRSRLAMTGGPKVWNAYADNVIINYHCKSCCGVNNLPPQSPPQPPGPPIITTSGPIAAVAIYPTSADILR